jgi:predicted transcriptional regulator
MKLEEMHQNIKEEIVQDIYKIYRGKGETEETIRGIIQKRLKKNQHMLEIRANQDEEDLRQADEIAYVADQADSDLVEPAKKV